MTRARVATVLELVGAFVFCLSIWKGQGIATVTSQWLGGMVGGAFLVLYAIAMERDDSSDRPLGGPR